jgi:hypothetical protein
MTDAAPRPTGAVIEILASGRTTDETTGGSLLLPKEVRVNGHSLCTPRGTRVQINDFALGDELVTVTLTFAARRIVIAAEGDLANNEETASKENEA